MIAIQGSNPEDELFPYDASLANQLSLYILNMDVNQPQFGFSYLPNLAGDTLERITNNNESEDIVRMGALVKKDLIFGNSNSTVKSKLSAIRKNFSYSDSNNSMKDSYTKAYNKANNFDEDLDEESDIKKIEKSTIFIDNSTSIGKKSFEIEDLKWKIKNLKE